MRTLIRLFYLLLALSFVFCHAHAFFLSGKPYLVSINGVKYYREDFKRWWRFWKDKNTKLTNSTLQDFIDWLLITDEAQRLGLEQEPSYIRKIKVFLKVRSILQLRHDEITKKLKMNKEMLWRFYKARYSPLMKLKVIMTDNKTEMSKWVSVIKSPKDFKKVYKELLVKDKNKTKSFDWIRPISVPVSLRKQIVSAKRGSIVGPVLYEKTWMLILVEDRKEASEVDFKRIQNVLKERYKKYMEAKLTAELVDRLKKKYKVEVKWNLISKVGLTTVPKELRNKTLIKIDHLAINASEFQSLLRKEIQVRSIKPGDRERLNSIKRFLVNSIISQTLIDMEALNRHYEKGPLRDIYWFYRKNRLVKEFFDKIVWPQVFVSNTDVKNYYKQHLRDFIKPETVEIAVIQLQDEKLIKSVYNRLMNGENFFDVARDVMFHGAVPRKITLNSLVPPVRKAVEKMKPGEISDIVRYKNWFFIVRLIKRYPKGVHSFKEVEASIRKMLSDMKFERLKGEYLSKLRSKSDVRVNMKEWRKLLKEMGGIR